MTASNLMSYDVVCLKEDDKISTALQLMRSHNIHNLPVVNNEGVFLGLFTLRRLSRELLPQAAKLNENSLMMHINFMSDTTDELLERMTQLGNKPVSKLLEKNSKLRFCQPDTSLPELLQLLFDSPVSVPVVVIKGKKKKLVGMISNWDVLTKLMVNLVSEKDNITEGQETHLINEQVIKCNAAEDN